MILTGVVVDRVHLPVYVRSMVVPLLSIIYHRSRTYEIVTTGLLPSLPFPSKLLSRAVCIWDLGALRASSSTPYICALDTK